MVGNQTKYMNRTRRISWVQYPNDCSACSLINLQVSLHADVDGEPIDMYSFM